MKRTVVITAITVASVLLVSCQSERDRKTEICAQWAATPDGTQVEEVAIAETWEKLGIKAEKIPAQEVALEQIDRYCDFYKS